PQFGPALRQLALLSGQRSADDPKAPDNPKLFDTVSKARLAYADDAELAKILGILNYRRGLFPQSAELLQQAAAKRHDHPQLLFYLGDAPRQLRQWKECKEVLERAVGMNLPSQLAGDAQRALAECSEAAP